MGVLQLPLVVVLIFLFSLFFFLTSAQATNSTTFILPIMKDSKTLQYYTSVKLGTPAIKLSLTLDISHQVNWIYPGISHYDDKKSTSKTPFPCSCHRDSNGAPCFYENNGCLINMCSAYIPCGMSDGDYYVSLIQDHLTLYQRPHLPNPDFSSGSSTILPSFPFGLIELEEVIAPLPQGASGILSLSRSPLSLINQLSTYSKIPRKFALCLPSRSPSSSSNSLNGAVYFGGGPYFLPPSKIDLSTIMLPIDILTVNFAVPRYRPGDIKLEYMIKIKSIKIGSTRVPFNSSLLEFGKVPFGDSTYDGGSKVTTMVPYTTLITDIYRPFVDLFVAKAEAMNMTRIIDSTEFYPFEACYNSSSIRYDAKTGPQVPVIDLMFDGFSPVIHNKRVRWRFYGSNSMKTVSIDVVCLAFVENFETQYGIPMASIMIGGKQMEDNLIEFDQDESKLRVNAFPLGKYRTSCSQFKGV